LHVSQDYCSEHLILWDFTGLLMLLSCAEEKFADAESLYRHVVEIFENKLGPEHPDVAISLGNLTELLYVRNKFTEAKLLYRRALRIMEKTVGKNHHSTVELGKHCAILRIK
jgi:hypothetical protein